MIDIKAVLTVFHDDNSSFTDYSENLVSYQRDTVTMELDKDDDYLYLGFIKPFGAFYVELSTANVNSNNFVAELYTDGSWSSIDISDDTKGFTRNGFIQFDRNTIDWEETEINSSTKFWIRLRPSITHSSTSLQGINIVFSDDQDLREEHYGIDRLLPSGQSSFILSHVAARNAIIQLLRNRGFIVTNHNENDLLGSKTNFLKNITQFDLLDIQEIRQASTFLALSKIFFARSDDPEGNYTAKANFYRQSYDLVMNTLFVSWDKNNDGLTSESEKGDNISFKRIIR